MHHDPVDRLLGHESIVDDDHPVRLLLGEPPIGVAHPAVEVLSFAADSIVLSSSDLKPSPTIAPPNVRPASGCGIFSIHSPSPCSRMLISNPSYSRFSL